MRMSGGGLHAPAGRVRLVTSFEELLATPFEGDVNAVCWRRRLPGDFEEIVRLIPLTGDITPVTDDALLTLPLSPEGAAARDVLLADLALLRSQGLDPALDCIGGYERDTAPGPVATDVYSFHADSATIAADTFLCTYAGSSSEGLANEDAIRKIDIPRVRHELLQHHGGPDDDAFAAFLSDHCHDLHYEPRAGAQPYRFGVGNLWRIAIAYPGAPVLPCIHRAPETRTGASPRLLLIS